MGRTRYSSVNRRTAVIIASATLLSAFVMVIATLGSPPAGAHNDDGSTDLDLYEAITSQMRGGENYYAAAHDELVTRGYGSRSVFNWRTPLYAEAVALAPTDTVAQVVLAGLAVVAGALTIYVLGRDAGRTGVLVGSVAVPLTLVTVFLPRTVLLAELTAGILILLSVGCYALRWRYLGQAAGILALFIRELSGVYVLVALTVAVSQRRWREAAIWSGGILAYGAYFIWHRHQVLSRLGPSDSADSDGWLQFGGPMFVLRTAQMDGVLVLLPITAVCVLLPLMLLGLFGWRGNAGTLAAATVFCYVIGFSVVGKPVNVYWGAMYTPLLAYGIGFTPAAARDLLARVAGRDSPNGAELTVPMDRKG